MGSLESVSQSLNLQNFPSDRAQHFVKYFLCCFLLTQSAAIFFKFPLADWPLLQLPTAQEAVPHKCLRKS